MRPERRIIFYQAWCVWLVLLALLSFGGCAAPSHSSGEQNSVWKTFYLVSHGWHAGIVVAIADIPESVWPQRNDFEGFQYIEAGWGDADYYRAAAPSLGTALKAALLPTDSVLHIAGFNMPVSRFFSANRVIALQTDDHGFTALCRFIAESYAADREGEPLVVGEGLYGASLFYRSNKTYILCSNCNVWAATALKKAGLPVAPLLTLTVESLMVKAEEYGTIINDQPIQ